MLTSARATKVILAIALSALVLGGSALVFGIAAYNSTGYSHIPTSVNSPVEVKEENTAQSSANLHNTDSTENVDAGFSKCEGLTGNLTVYLLLMTKSHYYDSAAILGSINDKVGTIEAAVCGFPYGASREGQEAYERVALTEQNITPDLTARFKIGDTVEMKVIKKSADSVKFYIDPAIKKPDGSPLSIEDVALDYSFGNGATCCGITLADGTDIGGIAVIVVDEAYDSIMMEKFPSIKAIVN